MEEQYAQDIQLTDERLNLFSRNSDGSEGISSTEKYNRLVELTDEIIANTGDLKSIVSEYANTISNYVTAELVPYYLALGRDYFLWLNSLI